MGGDFRQVGGDFLAKALDPEGPPQHRKPWEELSKIIKNNHPCEFMTLRSASATPTRLTKKV